MGISGLYLFVADKCSNIPEQKAEKLIESEMDWTE